MQFEMQYHGKGSINDTDLWTPLELLTYHDLLVKQKRKESEAIEAAKRKQQK